MQLMLSLIGDLRFAARALLHKPGITALAVVTLALGTGLTAAIFAVVDGVLLTPPSYPQAERIVHLSAIKQGQFDDGRCPVAGWVAWREEARSFETIAAYWWSFDYLIRDDGSQFIQGMSVTSNYFDLIGIKPLLGGSFAPSSATTGTEAIAGLHVLVLGYEFWQRAFNGDPQIIGKTVHVSRNDAPYTIIGVMPPGLRLLPAENNASEPNYDVNARIDFLAPVVVRGSKLKSEQCHVAGRLRPGVTLDQAQAELAAIAARHARAEGVSENIHVKAEPLLTMLNREGRRLLLPLMGAVALLFFIACGNVAGLLLSRGLQQQREHAVRRALGAGRAQLFSLALAEPLVLSILGGALGAGLALALVKIIKAIGGFAIPRLDTVAVGWPEMAVCLGLALAAALLAGMLPAVRACQLDPSAGLNSGGRAGSIGRAERRLLASAAVLQIILTLVLLVGAALLVRTVTGLAKVKPGFETKNILTMSVTTMENSDDFVDFHHRALERVSALPGVTKAAFAWGVPLTGNKWTGRITIEGQPDADKFADKTVVGERAITPDYFDALGVRLVAGRNFRPSDNWDNWNSTNKNIVAPTDSPFVAVINETMARQRFGTVNCLGKKLHVDFWDGKRPAEIIGVAQDIRSESLARTAEPEVYFPYWQVPAFTKHLIIKSNSDPRSLAAAVQHELRAVDPQVAIDHVKTLDQIRDHSIASQVLAMRLLAGFAVVGTILALVGIYGVLSLSVNSRNREFAIRMAVGAQRKDVLGLVLTEGLKLISLGLVAGIAVAISLARVLRALLFGVGPTDPSTIALVTILFTMVALAACFFPARRATRTDPVTALRYE